MSSPDQDSSLENMLERLRQGDLAAAESIFIAFEPYLRQMVRRQITSKMRAKFDSIDVVQSVWGDLLEGFRLADYEFSDVDRLRAFLVRATLNRFIDQVRRQRRSWDHEQPFQGNHANDVVLNSLKTNPVDEMIAKDVWQQLWTLCPNRHHEILILKRQGYNLAEIASRTGLHEGSVRRILNDLALRYAMQIQSEERKY